MIRRTLSIRLLPSVVRRFVALCRELGCTQSGLLTSVVDNLDCEDATGVLVSIASEQVLADVKCRTGQRYWWLRGPGGFVLIPASATGSWDQRRQGWLATQPIAFEIRLPPGIYTLGAGTRDHGVRQVVVVAPHAE